MPMALTNGQCLFFAHVPKTGGSSVEDYLIRRFGPLSLVDKHKRENTPGTGLITAITHLSALDLEEMIPPQVDLCFTLVRDPLARLLSEYRWQTGASRMSRFSFSTWLRIMVGALNIERRVYGNHIRPQTELVPEQAEIFRLEDGFEALIARLDEVTGTTAPDLMVGHFKNRQASAKPIEVSRQDAELVRRVYAADYERFGFSGRNLSELPNDPKAGLRSAFGGLMGRAVVAKQRRDWLK